MAKKIAVTPVETLDKAQCGRLDKLYVDIIANVLKGAEKWASVRAEFTVAGMIIAPLKKEASARFTTAWCADVRKRKGSELTVDEVTREKKYAQNEFSRGTKDPNAKPATRKAQTDGKKTDAQKPGKTDASATQPTPGMVASIEQLASRAKSIATELVAFQNHLTGAKVKLPTQGQEMLGALSESVAKLNEETTAILALLA